MPRPHGIEIERNCYESLLIVLDTLEQCLSYLPKDTARYDEAMNVKLLLRELCQFIGESMTLCASKTSYNWSSYINCCKKSGANSFQIMLIFRFRS